MERKEITGPVTESSPQVSEMTNVESDGTSGEEEGSNNPIDMPNLRRRRLSGPGFKSIESRNLLEDIVDSPVNGKDQTTVIQPTTFSEMDHSRIQFTLRASSHAHRKIRKSPLSSDAIFHQSHAGLFNLCIVILIAVNGRLIIESLMKYGLLIQTSFWFSSKSAKDWPLLMCGLTLPIFPLSTLLVEKMKVYMSISEGFVDILYLIITTTGIVYPAYVIHRVQSTILSSLILVLIALTRWMKLVSYAHTNSDIRALVQADEKPDTPQGAAVVEYPNNINVKNLAYFMVAPTLCYQMSYPRTEAIRKGWVLRQVGKLLVFAGLMGFITEQYINPTIKNSQHPLKGNHLYAIERILKLSIPVLYF